MYEEIKKVLLAGVGATATTLEKTKEFIDEMVQKGELTVKQGKEMNEELKHNIQKAFTKEDTKKDIVDQMDDLSEEELQAIKEKLEKLQKETIEIQDESN